ncbi:MAG: hypothetical protein JWP63_1508 [Candidatus Solibacter sp.]|nr:hypothetical protein [Candidatus Solibacter sp.]
MARASGVSGEMVANAYRRILRGADQNFPFWVALHEDKCIGQNYHKIRDFCRERELSLSRHGHSVTWKHEYYQVFMFAEEADAEVFRKEFGGEAMHPSEKGHGKNWARWKKETQFKILKSMNSWTDVLWSSGSRFAMN